jgi:3-deoxy-D-manno-octulosonic-acid transferase
VAEALPPKRGFRVWAHAASVGEVMAAVPILREHRSRFPSHEVIMTVITPGGHEVASAQVGKTLDAVIYAPFDAPAAVKRAVKAIQPDLYVNLETEIWPNLLHHVRASGARLVLVNGRISDRSFGSYRRLRSLFAWALGQFDRILVQTPADAERFVAIGARPERVEAFGNVKFDQADDRLTPEQVEALRADLRIPAGAPVLVVGSTRLSEEERQVFEAVTLARRSLPDLVLIHAPRHIDRAAEVVSLMRETGLSPLRRTEMAGHAGPIRDLVLDTFGELGRVYAVADAAFIGNSLAAPGGGQNLLQPLAQGKPALYGRYMQNFRDAVALAEQAGVGFRVENAEELAERLVALVNAPEERARIAEAAVGLIARNRGVAARYADALAALVPDQAGAAHVR